MERVIKLGGFHETMRVIEALNIQDEGVLLMNFPNNWGIGLHRADNTVFMVDHWSGKRVTFNLT